MGQDQSLAYKLNAKDYVIKRHIANSVYEVATRVFSYKIFVAKIFKSQSNKASKHIVKALNLFEQHRHPNLIQYIGFDNMMDDDINRTIISYYVVAERADCNLATFLEKNSNYFDNLDNIYYFMKQLLSVLYYLHLHNISHGNIKLNNILIIDKGTFKLDLEAGTFAVEEEYSTTPQDQALQLNYQPRERYVPPELLNLNTAKSYNPQKGDVYLLGLIFLKVCGYRKIEDFLSKDSTTIAQLLAKAPNSLENKYKYKDSNLIPFISKMLTLDAEARPTLFDLKYEFSIYFALNLDPLQRIFTPENPENPTEPRQFKKLDSRPLSQVKDLINLKEAGNVKLKSTGKITQVISLGNSKFVTLSQSLALWDLEKDLQNPFREIYIPNPLGLVKIFLLHDGNLLVANSESNLKIVNLQNDSVIKTFNVNASEILSCIELPENIYISGGLDCVIRFWDFNADEDKSCFKRLQSKEQGPCYSLIRVGDDKIACSSGGIVLFFDIFRGDFAIRAIGTNNDRKARDICLVDHGRLLAYWAKDVVDKKVRRIRVYNWQNAQCVRVMEDKVDLMGMKKMMVYNEDLLVVIGTELLKFKEWKTGGNRKEVKVVKECKMRDVGFVGETVVAIASQLADKTPLKLEIKWNSSVLLYQ